MNLDANTMAGGDAVDTIVGFENVTGGAGNDTLTGVTAGSILIGGAGNDNITGLGGTDSIDGGDGDDTLIGGAGADTLDGDAGSDSLTGNGGADIFVFDDNLGGAGEIDTINDFATTSDTIEVSVTVFTALQGTTGNNLSQDAGNEFLAIAGGAATSVNQRFIYDTTNGDLFYDDDGSNGNAASLVADLDPLDTGLVTLAAADIFIIA